MKLRPPAEPTADVVTVAAEQPIFIVADTHGEFEILAEMLQKHGVLDETLRWKFGRGHLVVLGDVFDRGPHQTEILWLLYELEAQARKARSIHQLQAEGVPTIAHLPTIETERDSTRRQTRAVVERAVALAIVAVKGETGDHDMGQALIRQFKAEDFFTPKEQAFMADPTPSQQERVNFAWRYEGVHVLLWALGINEELGRPDKICDVAKIAETLRELGTDGLMQRTRLRNQDVLLTPPT